MMRIDTEHVEVEVFDLIIEFCEYVPPCRGKAKVPKNIEKSKVTLYTPLLSDKISFEGPRLAQILMLKLEDWDLTNTEQFPHLVTDQLMHRILHKTTKVTSLEPQKWLKGVDKAGLLNLLLVPH